MLAAAVMDLRLHVVPLRDHETPLVVPYLALKPNGLSQNGYGLFTLGTACFEPRRIYPQQKQKLRLPALGRADAGTGFDTGPPQVLEFLCFSRFWFAFLGLPACFPTLPAPQKLPCTRLPVYPGSSALLAALWNRMFSAEAFARSALRLFP